MINIEVTNNKENSSIVDGFYQDAVGVLEQHILILGSFSEIEISLVISDDNFIQGLNKEYRGKDSATNVLSFPYLDLNNYTGPKEFVHLGDIIISEDKVKAEAKEQNKDFSEHLLHLFVHGFLHLLGYDHIKDDDAENMEKLEATILSALNIKNPYQKNV